MHSSSCRNSPVQTGTLHSRAVRALVWICAATSLAAPRIACATVVYVDSAGGGDYLTIGEGVDAASPGDTVLVACGAYTEACVIVEKDLYLRSETGDPDCVTLDGEHAHRTMACLGLTAEACIEGFTFLNGYQDNEWYDGGAVVCYNCEHTIRNCVFRDNTSVSRAGAISAGGNMTIEGCRFEGNSAGPWGGALYLWNDAVVTNCLFSDNESEDGGAVACDIWSNAVIEHCTFLGNTGTYGGAVVFSVRSHCTVRSCTFIQNVCLPGSGCIYVFDCSLSMENCIIASTIGGSAVVCPWGGTATLSCSDLFGNEGGDWTDCVAAQLSTAGNMCSDPLFCGSENPDAPWGLHADSPCAPANSPCGELIGSEGVRCSPTPVAQSTWGRLKALYRVGHAP